VHPRASKRLTEIGVPGGVRLVPPAGYLDFIALQNSARVVLTDSGGVQEETTALGVPCVTLRDNTERPVTVEQGTNVLAGRDPARVVATVHRVLDDPPAPRRPGLWDGRASDRIADVLLEGGTASSRPRPTDRTLPI
jgi:UDP-N-acetylglucosamine 2-epimerase (non-hydrolysing)